MKKGDIKGKKLFQQNKKNQMLYDELFQRFYRLSEIKGKAENTLKTYRYHHKCFMEFLKSENEHQTYCVDISARTLEDYILEM